MKKENYLINSIYLHSIIKNIWKEKFLIIIITSVFVFLNFVYLYNQKNKYRTYVMIEKPLLLMKYPIR